MRARRWCRGTPRGAHGRSGSPIPARPCPSVRSATPRPVAASRCRARRAACRAPTRAPSKRMVPSVQPFAVGTRSTVTPGVRRSMRNIDRPRDPRDDGSVRAIVPHQSLLCAPVTSTFSPSRTKPSSPSVDRGRRDVGEVGSGARLGVRDARGAGTRRSRRAGTAGAARRSRRRARSARPAPRRCRSSARRGTRPRSSPRPASCAACPPPP